MRKLFISVLLIVVTAMTINAQTNLFKGVKSGMTSNEFFNHCRDHSDLNYDFKDDYSYFITTIKGRKYMATPSYNNKDKLKALIFDSLDSYKWTGYDPNIKENAIELFNLLKTKYGEPTIDRWLDWTEIPEGKETIINSFEKNTITVIMNIKESNENYRITLYIIDSKFSDPEPKEKDTGGF